MGTSVGISERLGLGAMTRPRPEDQKPEAVPVAGRKSVPVYIVVGAIQCPIQRLDLALFNCL